MTKAPESTGQILLYRSEDGRTKLDVRLENETVWLSQRELAELFGKAKATLSEHIKHIFEDGELDPAATVRPFRTVQQEGYRDVSREVDFYNLDMVPDPGFLLGAAGTSLTLAAGLSTREPTWDRVLLASLPPAA